MPSPRRKRRPAPARASGGDGAAAGSRSAARDAEARAALRPLAPGERPAPLVVASALAAILAVAVLIGALTLHDLSRRGGSVPGAAFLATMLALAAGGMWRRRYWAVLGFQALLAFQILVTSLALVLASTIYAAVLCLVSVGLSGWLFWRLIRVLGRLQVTDGRRPAGDDAHNPRVDG